ncbi:hypothetical protein B4U84_13450 [Westiellopsis prolifica IICB1]|nr:hypothetical protein B4U84_13450 [Westiellopsis prolifica IICB1]
MVDREDISEVPLRPLVWMGDSRKNICEFPEEVRAWVGYALQLVQAHWSQVKKKSQLSRGYVKNR